MDTINTAVAKVPTTFDALAQSLDTVIAAQNNVVDVHNRGVSVDNTGNDRAAVAVCTGDGAVAVADFDAKAAADDQLTPQFEPSARARARLQRPNDHAHAARCERLDQQISALQAPASQRV